MPNPEELAQITEIERLTIRPGDALVVHIDDGRITDDQVRILKARVRENLGMPDIKIMVVGAGVRVSVVEHTAEDRLFDPDCRDGKHSSCIGGPCECPCHLER